MLIGLGVVTMAAAPVALVYYGKHELRAALAEFPGPDSGIVVRFDRFIFGGDEGYWAVRYKLVPRGQSDGLDAYLFIFPHFLRVDAPIFHS
jgi:hypothetical protein